MLYLDYNWFLTRSTMIPDAELDTNELNWAVGDWWVVCEDEHGKKFLKKADPLAKFLKDGEGGQ